MFKIMSLLTFIALIGGYVANIYKLATFVGAFGVEQAVRVFGMVAFPVGIIMGYIG
jgi:hypothetical protein